MDEEVLKIRNSRKIYVPVYLMIFILVFAVGFIKYSGKELNMFAFKLAVIFSILGIIFTETHRLRSLYEINDNFFVHIKGIFFKTTKRTDLSVISDVVIKQNPWQTIFGYGNVNVVVFSEVTPIKNVNKPMEIVSFLEKKMALRRVTEHKPPRSNK